MELLQHSDGFSVVEVIATIFIDGGVQDLGNDGIQVRMPAPHAFRVDHAQPALPVHFHHKLRARQGVGRVRHEGNVEAVGVNIPRGIHVFGGTSAARRDDGNLVEGVGAAGLAADAEFDVVTHGGP